MSGNEFAPSGEFDQPPGNLVLGSGEWRPASRPNANRANNIALARRLLAVPDPTPSSRASDHAENGRDNEDRNACPCCGGRMIIVEAFEPGCQPHFWPVPSIALDSS